MVAKLVIFSIMWSSVLTAMICIDVLKYKRKSPFWFRVSVFLFIVCVALVYNTFYWEILYLGQRVRIPY